MKPDPEICAFVMNLVDEKLVANRQELIDCRPDLNLGEAFDYLVKEDYILITQGKLALSLRIHSALAEAQLFLQTSPSGRALTDYLDSLDS